MKTAALLPTPGDPFLVKHWLNNCREVWRDEVDEVHVLVGGQPVTEARDYIREACALAGATYHERLTGGLVPHGVALNILISDCDADAVVLLEDDVRVRHSRAIEEMFAKIERDEYDVCASPRVSMTPNLEQAAKARWGGGILQDYAEGHGMWPAFVFAKREALRATDRDFGERSWGEKMVVPGLRYRVPEGEVAVCDCFGGTAFQLRDRCRVLDIPQWKGPHLWKSQLAAQDADMHWFHCGSLSSSSNLCADWDGPGGFEFMEGRTLTDPDEIAEWSHRLNWWRRCATTHAHELPELSNVYGTNWHRLRERMGVPVSEINRWTPVINDLITWRER